MKLFAGPVSPLCAKVRIALDEKGLEHECVEVPYSLVGGYSPRHPEVERINPKGQVPVLVDGELELYDSTVILEYLEDRYPDPPLMPRDVTERARCRQLEAYADDVFFPDVYKLGDLRMEAMRQGKPPEPSELAAAGARVVEHLRYLDRALAGRDYLAGEAFTVADLTNAFAARSAQQMGAPLDTELQAFSPWYARIVERPAFVAQLARMEAFGARQRG